MRTLRLYAPAITLIVWAFVLLLSDTSLLVASALLTFLAAVRLHVEQSVYDHRGGSR